jgi:hypothetical protein
MADDIDLQEEADLSAEINDQVIQEFMDQEQSSRQWLRAILPLILNDRDRSDHPRIQHADLNLDIAIRERLTRILRSDIDLVGIDEELNRRSTVGK